MMDFRLYLCGPITEEEYTRQWREEVAKQLEGTTIICLDPLRGKHKVRHLGFGTDKGIPGPLFVARDWHDIKRADLVLANFLYIPPRQMVGSLMELGACHAWDVPYILVADHEHFLKHPFLTTTAVDVVPTLQKGIQAVRFYFKE